jgi:hypothetical protein
MIMNASLRFKNGFLSLVLAVSTFGALSTAVAQKGTMYSWTDENGVVHFSDQAPEGLEVQAQALPESPPPGSVNPLESGAAPAEEAPPSAAQQRRDEVARKARENQERQATNQAQCEAWQAELEQIEPNRRVFFTNDEGETERMDDVVRTDRVAELHRLISENCT